MKKHVFLIVLMLIATQFQVKALERFWYSGTAFNETGQILPDETNLTVRITIYKGNTQQYSELHNAVSTNQFGTYTVEVGSGSSTSGDFAATTKIRRSIRPIGNYYSKQIL